MLALPLAGTSPEEGWQMPKEIRPTECMSIATLADLVGDEYLDRIAPFALVIDF
jgi:hypothetical protein